MALADAPLHHKYQTKLRPLCHGVPFPRDREREPWDASTVPAVRNWSREHYGSWGASTIPGAAIRANT
jgi:hypothetical protein